jgi:hypothetical protein
MNRRWIWILILQLGARTAWAEETFTNRREVPVTLEFVSNTARTMGFVVTVQPGGRPWARPGPLQAPQAYRFDGRWKGTSIEVPVGAVVIFQSHSEGLWPGRENTLAFRVLPRILKAEGAGSQWAEADPILEFKAVPGPGGVQERLDFRESVPRPKCVQPASGATAHPGS